MQAMTNARIAKDSFGAGLTLCHTTYQSRWVGGVTDYAIFMLDPIVVSWNRGAEKIKGYTSDEIIGQHVSKFHGNADRSAGVPARLLYTAAQEGRFEGDGWRARKDGNQFWTNVAIDAIRDDTGQLIGFAKRKRGFQGGYRPLLST